jgi:DNA-binding response OmpR family regulator
MAHILLVEDDAWIAECYSRWLQADGHRVRVSCDAQEAIDYVDDLPPDLIVLDLLLPHANGVQLLHTLQSYSDLASIPVLLCSSSLTDDMPDVTHYGITQVLPKAELTPHRLRAEAKQALAHAAV